MLSPEELNAVPVGLVWLAWAVFVLGGCLCVGNFWIFIDWLRYELRKPPKEPRKHVSAIPIFGSLLVYFMLKTLGSIPAAMVIGIVLIAIDTGGIPWMIAGIVYQIYLALRRAIR
jgi:hypothetical protein